MTTKDSRLTITLTNRRPVRILTSNWDVIASAKDWDNQYEFQANRTWKLTVRQNEDGRTLVYGTYNTHFQGESGRRGGELLDDRGDVPAAIRRVGEHLGMEESLIEECIADLPPMDLDGPAAEESCAPAAI